MAVAYNGCKHSCFNRSHPSNWEFGKGSKKPFLRKLALSVTYITCKFIGVHLMQIHLFFFFLKSEVCFASICCEMLCTANHSKGLEEVVEMAIQPFSYELMFGEYWPVST